VFVDVTLFLGERDVTLGYASGVMHALGEQHSLFLVELFTSVHWRLRPILVLGCTRLGTLELESAYSNALVMQGELRVVYHISEQTSYLGSD
jgi:hypothetical protein